MNTRIVTVEDLVRYLFGEPLDPRDLGLLGRLSRRIERMERLLWSIFLVLFTASLALIANLITVLHQGHFP